MTYKTGFLSLQAACIGQMAKKLISETTEGFVLGCSSRGIYILAGEKWVIFFSGESFRGPLTVNIPQMESALETVSAGMSVRISPGRLAIPEAKIEFLVKNCPIWQIPKRPRANPQAERLRILESFIFGIPNWGEMQNCWGCSIKKVYQLLGKGAGLTPFGDDIIIGLLLSLNRWGDSLKPGTDFNEFNKQIVAAAYRNTTTLSANLIECAVHGSADERLIRTIDYLMCANSHPDTVRDDLLKWGHSSGLGTLIGMAIAIGSPEP